MRTCKLGTRISRSLPFFIAAVLVLFPTVGSALEPAARPMLQPDEILVIANVRTPRSVALARYYMMQRKIPGDRLLLLWAPDDETCGREEYDDLVASPVRRHLLDNPPSRPVRCLLLMYGLPLKVAPPKRNPERDSGPPAAQDRRGPHRTAGTVDPKQSAPVEDRPEKAKKRTSGGSSSDQWASLDSEIALVLARDYPLAGWIPNPDFIGRNEFRSEPPIREAFMVSRLDASSVAIVRRIIDDSLEAEEKGLKGIAYFDARWSQAERMEMLGSGSGYGYYDRSVRKAADLVRKSRKMEVVLDEQSTLFQPGACPDAALYCGWYSLARYVDAFQWARGSVGYHIASSECSTLKNRYSRVWCKMMLEKGVAVTLGPVNEPYLAAFPLPELFFSLLLKGSMTLAECYTASNPYVSWKMVLIGDPLYRPFKEYPGRGQ
ncbi:MAG: TIGR03790 family protein [Deltaproteobacteria bacterium]|nr:TIGR03790 family protein [Deltaproteobacteria bacterium]